MEDLWKDITLSTLSSLHHPSPAQPHHHLRSSSSSSSSVACTTIFQDFLARPFSLHNQYTTNILVSPSSTSPSPTPQTLLSLNTDHPPHFHQHSPHHSSFDIISTATASSSSAHHHFGKRLLQHETESHDMNSGSQCPSGRRHKRMIKNRESAARSRARKQAYTTELELEVAQLKQENARLRMEQETKNAQRLQRGTESNKAPHNSRQLARSRISKTTGMCLDSLCSNRAASSDIIPLISSGQMLNQTAMVDASPKKHKKLHRTSTAPF